MPDFYIIRPDGSEEGPYQKNVLCTLVAAGHYPPGTLAWCEGLAEWLPLENIPELQSVASQEAPAPGGTQAEPAPSRRLPRRKHLLFGAGGLAALLLLALGLILLCRNGEPGPILSDEDALAFYDAKTEEYKEAGNEEWFNLQRFRSVFERKMKGRYQRDQDGVVSQFAEWNSRDGCDYFIDVRGFKPSHEALTGIIFARNLDMLHYLIDQKGVKPQKESLNDVIRAWAHANARAEESLVPLRYLVEKCGVEPNSDSLDVAIREQSSHPEAWAIVRYLVEEQGVQASSWAVYMVCCDGEADKLRFLVEKGRGAPKGTELKDACRDGYLEVVDYLVDHAGQELTHHCLREAATCGKLKVVQSLIEKRGMQPQAELLEDIVRFYFLKKDEEEEHRHCEEVSAVLRYLMQRFPQLELPDEDVLRGCKSEPLKRVFR